MRSRSLLTTMLAFTAMLFACQQTETTQTAQDFNFKTLKGEVQSIASLKGKPLVLNYFGLH
jgi:ABC-type uncharacterized transport system auxiliary subunit